MKNIIQNILKDVKTELSEEFDNNFNRKAFFDKPWKQTRFNNNRGSLMMRSGDLRRGNRSTIEGKSVHFTNAMPYANIQNEGGTITVTAKMISFFWAMYYKSAGASQKGIPARKQAMSEEAMKWKYLALMKVGSKMKIEQRQFIGWHPSLNPRIEKIVGDNLKEMEQYIKNRLER